jgi:hypothetical protein
LDNTNAVVTGVGSFGCCCCIDSCRHPFYRESVEWDRSCNYHLDKMKTHHWLDSNRHLPLLIPDRFLLFFMVLLGYLVRLLHNFSSNLRHSI